jgi:hypothetical protein
MISRFHPNGKTLLNRTEWRGKEPRSCAVTKVESRPHVAGNTESLVFEIEVSYRPKGFITYLGDTRYDGWTAMLLNRDQDGTLLDDGGNPLSEGEPPIHVPYEVCEDVDFNDIDFGEFLREYEVQGIKYVQFDNVMRELMESGSVNTSTFMAPRRQRPYMKIVLSNAPSGTGSDGFGTRIININRSTPRLEQVLMDHLAELVSAFIEGRCSLKTISTHDFVFIELSDALVDCTPNETGKESRFDCLSDYVSGTFFEELAKRLMATYELDVNVVEGKNTGLLLRRVVPRSR